MAFKAASQVLLLDPSSGGLSTRDKFTGGRASWCIDELPEEAYQRDAGGQRMIHPWGEQILRAEWRDWKPSGPPFIKIHEVFAFDGGFAGNVTGDEIADELARVARTHGIRVAHSDQRESLFLTTALSQRSITLHCHTWTNPSKAAAVALLRRWLADGTLSLPPSANEMKRELLAFEEVISPASGMLTFGARRGGHDDYVALLITLAHAELNPETRLPRSNLGPHFQYGRLQT